MSLETILDSSRQGIFYEASKIDVLPSVVEISKYTEESTLLPVFKKALLNSRFKFLIGVQAAFIDLLTSREHGVSLRDTILLPSSETIDYLGNSTFSSINHVLCNRDIFLVASTGTGKTLAYAVILINDSLSCPSSNNYRNMIVVLTRELGIQVLNQFSEFAIEQYFTTNEAEYLGQNWNLAQLVSKKNTSEVSRIGIGTVKEILEANITSIPGYVVWDEADELFSQNESIFLCNSLLKSRTTTKFVFVSATLPEFGLKPLGLSPKNLLVFECKTNSLSRLEAIRHLMSLEGYSISSDDIVDWKDCLSDMVIIENPNLLNNVLSVFHGNDRVKLPYAIHEYLLNNLKNIDNDVLFSKFLCNLINNFCIKKNNEQTTLDYKISTNINTYALTTRNIMHRDWEAVRILFLALSGVSPDTFKLTSPGFLNSTSVTKISSWKKVILFCNDETSVLRISKLLHHLCKEIDCAANILRLKPDEVLRLRNAITADSIHVVMHNSSANFLNRIFQSMKSSETSVIISSKRLERGIDLLSLDGCIHLGLPYDYKTFIHRSGRSGRADRRGSNIIILQPGDYKEYLQGVVTDAVYREDEMITSWDDLHSIEKAHLFQLPWFRLENNILHAEEESNEYYLDKSEKSWPLRYISDNELELMSICSVENQIN